MTDQRPAAYSRSSLITLGLYALVALIIAGIYAAMLIGEGIGTLLWQSIVPFEDYEIVKVYDFRSFQFALLLLGMPAFFAVLLVVHLLEERRITIPALTLLFLIPAHLISINTEMDTRYKDHLSDDHLKELIKTGRTAPLLRYLSNGRNDSWSHNKLFNDAIEENQPTSAKAIADLNIATIPKCAAYLRLNYPNKLDAATLEYIIKLNPEPFTTEEDYQRNCDDSGYIRYSSYILRPNMYYAHITRSNPPPQAKFINLLINAGVKFPSEDSARMITHLKKYIARDLKRRNTADADARQRILKWLEK